jgi:hypothetical protein
MHLCLTVECIASGLHLSVFQFGLTPSGGASSQQLVAAGGGGWRVQTRGVAPPRVGSICACPRQQGCLLRLLARNCDVADVACAWRGEWHAPANLSTIRCSRGLFSPALDLLSCPCGLCVRIHSERRLPVPCTCCMLLPHMRTRMHVQMHTRKPEGGACLTRET